MVTGSCSICALTGVWGFDRRKFEELLCVHGDEDGTDGEAFTVDDIESRDTDGKSFLLQ